MDDRLFCRVQHLQNIVSVGAAIEEIADIELLQIFIAVELLVIGIDHCIELALVLGHQHGLGIAPEV